MKFSVVHQDRSLVVVDKPSGLPTQSPKGGGENLYDLLRGAHPYVGLHHRLDTPASGLVLFTLDKRANAAIAKGFRTHTIQREYQVMVIGDPGEGGCWQSPIDSKHARTHWTRVGTGGGMSVLAVQLETGRTHQIRRHAAEHGHPVCGDRRYGGAAGGLWPRLALHARRLALPHPITGTEMSVSAQVPSDLQALWAKALQRPGSQAP